MRISQSTCDRYTPRRGRILRSVLSSPWLQANYGIFHVIPQIRDDDPSVKQNMSRTDKGAQELTPVNQPLD
jgi:hypothetical protein